MLFRSLQHQMRAPLSLYGAPSLRLLHTPQVYHDANKNKY